ncbi:MAG TPA: VC0807 family protein [Gaiellaceae bacterium]|nr:VC0807 family protein [Gaiellaceae bacterium]
MRAAGAPVAPGRLDDLPDPTWRSILGRGLPQFAAEAVVPVLVFYGAWRAAGLGAGIAAGTVVSVALAGVLLRRGRDVTLVVVGAAFVVVQAVVGLASHSATVYLAQPVLLNALWGLACFVSIAIRRPLIGVLAGAWYPFPAWFRASDAFRREFSVQSAVFGVFYVARAALRLWALLTTGVGGFVVVSVATGSPVVLVLIGWGVWHARRTFSAL